MHAQSLNAVVAHRLSTIEHADKIIYLEKGEKIAEGPKEVLLKTCPGFKKMWDMMHQFHPTKVNHDALT